MAASHVMMTLFERAVFSCLCVFTFDLTVFACQVVSLILGWCSLQLLHITLHQLLYTQFMMLHVLLGFSVHCYVVLLIVRFSIRTLHNLSSVLLVTLARLL